MKIPRHTDQQFAGWVKTPSRVPREVRDLIEEFGLGDIPRLTSHKNAGLEIVHVRRGRLSWKCEGKRESVGPDTAYFTLPWQQHGSCSEYESGHEWAFVVIRMENASSEVSRAIRFPKALGFDSKTNRWISRAFVGTSRHVWPTTPLLREMMSALVSELIQPGAYLRSRTIHFVSLLVLELAATIEGKAKVARSEDSDHFSGLISLLRKHCEQNWTLNQMAGLAGLKRTHFSERFRRATGDSPMRFLHRIRMDRARQLLKNSDIPVTGVAMECGYCTSQHFARVFKEFCGVTALEYRWHGAPRIKLPLR